MSALVLFVAMAVQPEPKLTTLANGFFVRELHEYRKRIEVWQPCQFRPGMVIISASRNIFIQGGFALAGEPYFTHAVIVIAIDGELHVVDADRKDGVHIVELVQYLEIIGNVYREPIWVLDPGPLTNGQSAAMTHFAMSQKGKRYAPLGDLLRAAYSKPFAQRTERIIGAIPERWFCSQIVVETLQSAGLLTHVRADSMTPHDLMRHYLGPQWRSCGRWHASIYACH